MGTPSELLEHPPNSFVASFLAGFLILAGVARRTTDGKIEVETSSGRLQLQEVGSETSDGESVRIYVKPSRTRLVGENGGVSRLRGRVVGVTRTVDSVAFHVTVDDQRIEVPHPPSSGWTPKIGEEIFVEAPPSACLLAEKET